MRLDKYLTEQFGSRTKAQDAIREGRVSIRGKIITKPGYSISEPDSIAVASKENEYVSRSGAKLKKAVDECGIDLTGKTVLDIGASTGGFTEVCLQSGATRVYALDVGHLQLARKLDDDPRVIKMEGFNARDLRREDIKDPVDFICMDVSFISAKTVLEPVLANTDPDSMAVLIKPQFECGPEALNKHGVLKDNRVRSKILLDMKTWLLQYFRHVRIVDDVLAGRSGNREAILYAWERRPS